MQGTGRGHGRVNEGVPIHAGTKPHLDLGREDRERVSHRPETPKESNLTERREMTGKR